MANIKEAFKTPVIICGAEGRMGSALKTLLAQDAACELKAAITRGQELSYKDPCVVIDFSHHASLATHTRFALDHKQALLICTTGHDAKNKAIMREAAAAIPVLYAPNTSIMVSLVRALCEKASHIAGLEAYITDIHHAKKKDAPSGTALALKEALGVAPISITSIRTGEVIGEHRVQLFKENEQLELMHRVSDRMVFAEGALIAAQFLFGQAPGLYSMSDVVNLKLTI